MFCESQPPTQERCTPPRCQPSNASWLDSLNDIIDQLDLRSCCWRSGFRKSHNLQKVCMNFSFFSVTSIFLVTTSASNLSSMFYTKYHLPVRNSEKQMLTLCLCRCAGETTAATMALCTSCWIATDFDGNRTLSLSDFQYHFVFYYSSQRCRHLCLLSAVWTSTAEL
jgi:hypothetical protein